MIDKSVSSLEGGTNLLYMEDFRMKNSPMISGKALEVGPKHGLHTLWLSDFVQDITCVELPEKKGQNDTWRSKVKSSLNFVYEDLLRVDFKEKFDVILFNGVIYHNTEQLRLLKKLRALASENCVLFFESSTSRNPLLRDKNVIEVHWPERYRGTSTVIFHPTQQACVSLLEIAGWKVIDENRKNENRFMCVCSPSSETLHTYKDVNHKLVNGDS